jgi:predicted Zn-dependent protease with MMP-like domain
MTLHDFELLVADALDQLPAGFAKRLDNVEVVVEIWPSPEDLKAGHAPRGTTLFGLYRGIPQTRRGTYQAVVPDRISIFAGPIVRVYGENYETVKTVVRQTVLHEIGHHFGMNEDEIRDAMGS